MTDRPLYITTSWDDGHELDLRVAERLQLHGLKGTFYLPRSFKSTAIPDNRVRQLAADFEVGGHTMHHVDLLTVSDGQARVEIADSRAWLESLTGRRCLMFCFPNGHFHERHLGFVRDAGFLGARTTELLSTRLPAPRHGVLQMPTTVQAHPHPDVAYLRNAAKRCAWHSLVTYLRHGRNRDWSALARSVYAAAAANDGVFHLWGHSWEIEIYGQWQRLEEVLRFLGEMAPTDRHLTNGEVCTLVAGTIETGAAHSGT